MIRALIAWVERLTGPKWELPVAETCRRMKAIRVAGSR